MKTSLEILAGIMLLVSIVSGTIQTYPTDFGKVQIDMPYILAPEDGRFISGTSLQLGLEIPPNDAFPNIKWLNIMGINLHNPATYGAKNVEDLTNLMLGNTSDPDFEYQVQEMITNDNHRMLFYTEEGRPPYHYYAFIDYQEEKNCVVEIDALSEKYYFKPITTFDRAEFQDICRSFTFNNGD